MVTVYLRYTFTDGSKSSQRFVVTPEAAARIIENCSGPMSTGVKVTVEVR